MGTKRFKIYEKHVALDVSLKLGEYISNTFPNIEIIYTRKNDVFLELHERTEIANRKNADLFISVHCDGFTNSNASGASVFVMGMSKLKANLDVAMRENSAIYMEDNYKQTYEGFDPKSPESNIVFSLMQNTYLDQSLQLAEFVEHEFSTTANRKSRGVKQAPFYVISRTNMPSILIECGFLTNPKEEEFLHTDKGKDFIASAIYRAFKSYKENIENINLDSVNSTQTPKRYVKKEIIEPKKPDIIFKVQIGTFLKSMIKDELFEILDAQEIFTDGVYKYYIGNELSKIECENLKDSMIKKGFKDAFIVPFYKNKRISVKEALDLQIKLH
jgi:N-acetylmuramoyl-L-alanine amidase